MQHIDQGEYLKGKNMDERYSDMWEVFQYAGYATENNAPLVLDREPTVSGVQGKSHPGVSNIENFMTLDTVLQVTADAGEKIRFGLDQSGIDLGRAAFRVKA